MLSEELISSGNSRLFYGAVANVSNFDDVSDEAANSAAVSGAYQLI